MEQPQIIIHASTMHKVKNILEETCQALAGAPFLLKQLLLNTFGGHVSQEAFSAFEL